MRRRVALLLVAAVMAVGSLVALPRGVAATSTCPFLKQKIETMPFAQNTVSILLALYYENDSTRQCFNAEEKIWVSSGSGVMGGETQYGAILNINYGPSVCNDWQVGAISPVPVNPTFTWPRNSVAWAVPNDVAPGGESWQANTENDYIYNSGNTRDFQVPVFAIATC